MGKREHKRRQMAALMERWQASGLTAEAFVKRERVPESRLWTRRLWVDPEASFQP